MELKKKTIIWEENTVPPKNYLWVKPDGKIYEWTLEDKDWVESKQVQLWVDPNAVSYSEAETTEDVTDAITAYEEKQTAAGRPISPTATITVTYDEDPIPSTITLPETTHPITLKGDFSQNSNTVIESNGNIEKVTINNTGEEANVTIDLPTTTATIAGNYNTVTVRAVSNETLTVAVGAHIKNLVLIKGTVKVNNAYIEDNVANASVIGGTLKANDPIDITAENVSASKFTSTPRIVNVKDTVAVRTITFGAIASGHYVFNNEGIVNTDYTNGGVLMRSSVHVDYLGNGEWHSTNNPTIWASGNDVKVRIYDGKFFNDNNYAECIYAEKGLIEIYGGEFHNTFVEGQKNFLLNCKDVNYQAGTANIVVYGGKFYGFDPAANAAESVDMTTNFVAPGYRSVNQGDYFEVIKDE